MASILAGQAPPSWKGSAVVLAGLSAVYGLAGRYAARVLAVAIDEQISVGGGGEYSHRGNMAGILYCMDARESKTATFASGCFTEKLWGG